MCARTGSSTVDADEAADTTNFADADDFAGVDVDVGADVGADVSGSAPSVALFDFALAIEPLRSVNSLALSGSTSNRFRSNRFKSCGTDSFDPRECIDRTKCTMHRTIGDDARGKSRPDLREQREFAGVGAIDIYSMRMYDHACRRARVAERFAR
jgi:hypothetical protein